MGGVPEQPIARLRLTPVTIAAKRGLTVRNATVATTTTAIEPASGPADIPQSKAPVE